MVCTSYEFTYNIQVSVKLDLFFPLGTFFKGATGSSLLPCVKAKAFQPSARPTIPTRLLRFSSTTFWRSQLHPNWLVFVEFISSMNPMTLSSSGNMTCIFFTDPDPEVWSTLVRLELQLGQKSGKRVVWMCYLKHQKIRSGPFTSARWICEDSLTGGKLTCFLMFFCCQPNLVIDGYRIMQLWFMMFYDTLRSIMNFSHFRY